MTDINDLLQEFWTSSDGAQAVGTSFFPMRSSCLFGILKECFNSLEVCFDILRLLSTFLIKIFRHRQPPAIPGVIATRNLTTESA